jgi:signal transduction histidine kinase
VAAPEAGDDRDLDLLRRRVINVVGHELRTPVTTLRGLAELLAEPGLTPARSDEVRDALVRTARRTEALLDDLLVAAGVTTALPVAPPRPTPVGGSIALARPGVVDRITSALLDNAERYAGGTGALQVERRGADVVLVVADRGPGVPEEELPLLTEPFFRGEQAVLTHHALGLGLAVAKALAEQDGGSLRVADRDGGGLVVEVRLPAAEAGAA